MRVKEQDGDGEEHRDGRPSSLGLPAVLVQAHSEAVVLQREGWHPRVPGPRLNRSFFLCRRATYLDRLPRRRRKDLRE